MLQLLKLRRSLRGQRTDAHVLMATRVLRSFGDGFVSLVLARYLSELAFSGFQIGIIATATLLGTSAATLLVRALADRLGRRRALLPDGAVCGRARSAGARVRLANAGRPERDVPAVCGRRACGSYAVLRAIA